MASTDSENTPTGVNPDLDGSSAAVVSDMGFRQAVDSAPEGIVITDPSQKDDPIIYINKAFTEMTGYQEDEALGRNCRFLQGDDRNQKGLKTLRDKLEKEEKVSVLLRNYTKDGELFYNQLSISPLYDSEGKLTNFVGVQRDVTERVTAGQDLKRSEERFRRLFETSTNGVTYLNKDGMITDANPAAQEILGLKQGDMEGRFVFDDRFEAVDEDGQPIAQDNFPVMRALQSGQPVKSEVIGVHNPQTNRRHWIMVSAVPQFHDGESEPYQVYATFEDITERKKIQDKLAEKTIRLKKDKARDEAILESIGEGLVVTDTSGKILEINQAAQTLLHRSKEDIGSDRHIDDVLRMNTEEDEVISIQATVLPKVLEGKEFDRDFQDSVYISRNEGDSFAASINISPIYFQGEITGTVIVFDDMSEEKELDRAKTEFVSLASHQLRTPLSTIAWYVEMLLDGDGGEITGKQQEFLKEIHSSNERMIDLVNALLNVSRMELGTFAVKPEMVDTIKEAEDVIEDFNKQLSDSSVEMKARLDTDIPEINLDKNLLRIIFQNLLSNAVKYTRHSDGERKIKFEVTKDDDYLLITVSDTGIGIPENERHKVFGKLFRASNAQKTDADGTGLGMYIVKSILEETGGDISFTSRDNEGTTFNARLPLTGMEAREGKKELKEDGF